MADNQRVSLQTLIYCVLNGHEAISDDAVPSDRAAFTGADRLVPLIVNAAISGSVTFYGIPTQTRFPIREEISGDGAVDAIRKAIACLGRTFNEDGGDASRFDTHLAERYLSEVAEPVPPEAWNIESLAWEANHLLVWNSAVLDSRFKVCLPQPKWIKNPLASQQLDEGVSVEGNPYLRDVAQYEPMEISGYSSLVARSTDVDAMRRLTEGDVAAGKDKIRSKDKPGRKPETNWDALNAAAEILLAEKRIPKRSWDAVLAAVIQQAELTGSVEDQFSKVTADSWKKHLDRHSKDLLGRLKDAKRRNQ